MRRRFKSDPKWLTVRYPAKCAKSGCEVPITAGERAFHYPEHRTFYGFRCGHGEEAASDFATHRVDEDGY